MEIAEHITAVGQEASLFAEAARAGGLDVEIAGCPGWDMRDLVRHLSEIHLWAAAHIAQPHEKPWVDDLAELTEFWPDLAVFWPEDGDLIDHYLDTNANLIGALEAAPLDVESFTFLPAPSPLAMWARRQAHEIAVHRFDAEDAAGTTSSFDPAFASDGVDELLAAFAPRASELPRTTTQAIVVHATDTDDRWHVTLSPEGISTVRGDGPADVTLTGHASDLYLALWNRNENADVTVTGDQEVFEFWHQNHRVRWSS
ncbi:MAG TPA: maleylpyruvate isomerase family mycothiol-dependent enzyme [Actinobacteria bacterium]|nr:maleylpyruvate isomerase family mycothiol-dependent enzyme [Actinomycetota bacterium]